VPLRSQACAIQVKGPEVLSTDCEASRWNESKSSESCRGGLLIKTRPVMIHPGNGMACPPLELACNTMRDVCATCCARTGAKCCATGCGRDQGPCRRSHTRCGSHKGAGVSSPRSGPRPWAAAKVRTAGLTQECGSHNGVGEASPYGWPRPWAAAKVRTAGLTQGCGSHKVRARLWAAWRRTKARIVHGRAAASTGRSGVFERVDAGVHEAYPAENTRMKASCRVQGGPPPTCPPPCR
jgi:hypothetical protein